jgi:hypothetical protein
VRKCDSKRNRWRFKILWWYCDVCNVFEDKARDIFEEGLRENQKELSAKNVK